MASRTITNAGEELFPQNKLRKSFAIENEDKAIQIFIKRPIDVDLFHSEYPILGKSESVIKSRDV